MRDPIGRKPRSSGADRAAVRLFGSDMLAKLEENSHKAHWSTVSNRWLLMRLAEECQELMQALVSLDRGQGMATDVIDECADVANFAMMIADNVRTGRGKP